jgi:hypothetical protein
MQMVSSGADLTLIFGKAQGSTWSTWETGIGGSVQPGNPRWRDQPIDAIGPELAVAEGAPSPAQPSS